MLGKDTADGSRIVKRLENLTNSFAAAEQYHRFSLDPRELMQLEKRAADAGLAVLGFYHSHPDHPARPSETTAGTPGRIIVMSSSRSPNVNAVDLTSWQLDESTEQFKPEEIESGIRP